MTRPSHLPGPDQPREDEIQAAERVIAESPESTAADEITWSEVAHTLEWGAWVALLLAPGLYFINGPAVSNDQSVTRCILVGVAASTAISLTGRRLLLATRRPPTQGS